MKPAKIIIFTFIAFLLSTLHASAKMLLFVGESCQHCQKLEEYLEKNQLYDKHGIEQYEIYNNEKNRNLYLAKAVELSYRNGGVPWLVDGEKQIEGTNSIIDYLNGLDSKNQSSTILSNQTVLDRNQSEMLNSIIQEETKNGQTPNQYESENKPKTLLYALVIIILLAGLYLTIHKRRDKE